MKTIEVNIYSFNELSDEAKQVAIENYRNKDHYTGIESEYENSLDAFFNAFDNVIRQANGSRQMNEYIWTASDELGEISGWRLAAKLWTNYGNVLYKGKYYGRLVDTYPDGKKIEVSKDHPAGLRHPKRHSNVMFEHSCVLTGYCFDDDILEPIYKFLDKPDNTTFSELMGECLEAWEKSVERDAEWRNSDEYISEEIEANEYQFTEDGKEFN